MTILVHPHNENEQKVLIAFLESLNYDYNADIKEGDDNTMESFLLEYNREIEAAGAEIDAGIYIEHSEVEKLLANRRKIIGSLIV